MADDRRTLRDWFAGQALVGMAPVVCKPGCQYEPQEGNPASVEEFTAAVVYSLADAMLAERAKVDGADPPAGSAEYDPARLGEMTAVDGTLKPVCGWETTGPLGRFRCRMPKGHEDGEHYGRWHRTGQNWSGGRRRTHRPQLCLTPWLRSLPPRPVAPRRHGAPIKASCATGRRDTRASTPMVAPAPTA